MLVQNNIWHSCINGSFKWRGSRPIKVITDQRSAPYKYVYVLPYTCSSAGEQCPYKAWVLGSNPSRCTDCSRERSRCSVRVLVMLHWSILHRGVKELGRPCRAHNPDIVGSNPISPTIMLVITILVICQHYTPRWLLKVPL